MILRLKTHPKTPGIVLAHTPPELAHTMGAFAPARWSETSRAYLVEEVHLEALVRFVAHHDVQVVDERGTAVPDNVRPKFTGPLPECAECGQPASRQAAETMRVCPACGAPWVAVVPAATVSGLPAVSAKCGACGRVQRGRFAYCGDCGEPMPAPAAPDPRPETDRPRLAEPVRLAEAIAATLPGLVLEAPLDATTRSAREVTCPWCGAAPGAPCIVAGTDRTLTMTATHPARNEAAGVGPPRIVAEDLAARRSTPPGTPRRDPDDDGERDHMQRAAGDR